MRLPRALRAARKHDLNQVSLLILLTQGFTSAIGIVFWGLTARQTGAMVTGLAGTLISTISATTLFATTGLTEGSLRLLTHSASSSAERYLQLVSLIFATAILSLLGGIVLVTVVPQLVGTLGAAANLKLAPALVLGVVGVSLGQLVDSISLATSNTYVILCRGVVGSLTRMLVFLLPGRPSLAQLIWAFALSTLSADLLSTALLRPSMPATARLRASLSTLWELRSYYVGYHLTTVGAAASVYLLPSIVLGLLGTAAAGFYYPTWLLGGLFFTVSPAVSAALLAKVQSTTLDLGRRVKEAGTLTLILLAGPLMLALIAPSLILSLLGPQYAEHSSSLLRILAFSALPDAITNLSVAVLRVRGRLRAATLLNLTISAVALTSASWFLMRYGIAGAGLAWLTAQSVGAVFAGYLLRQERRASV